MIKVRFLGTNGWFDTATGNTVCILIETDREYIVLDAGNGLYKLDRYITTQKPVYLFISHFHLDHIIGLHLLAKFRFRQGINICIEKGRKKDLNGFVSKKFTLPFKRLATKVRVLEFGAKKKDRALPFLLAALRLKHPVPCFGFRFAVEGKIVSYIADTGVCENAFRLARNADLLITECAMKPGMGSADWPHLDPLSAARIAKNSKAQKLVLVHFDAEIYKTMKDRKLAEISARNVFGNSTAAKDDLMIKV